MLYVLISLIKSTCLCVSSLDFLTEQILIPDQLLRRKEKQDSQIATVQRSGAEHSCSSKQKQKGKEEKPKN